MQASGDKSDIGKIDEVKGRVLDTKVHANDDKGNPEEGNLATGDVKQGGREVLTTGSFNLTDTVASVLEEVNDKWKMLDPFKEKSKGPNELTMAALDYLEMNPNDATDFSGFGGGIADLVETIKPQVEAMGNAGAGAVEKGGGLLGKGIAKAGKMGGGLLSGAGNLANKAGKKLGGGFFGKALGGLGKMLGGAGDSAKEGGQAAGDAVSGAASQTADSIRFFIGQLDGFTKSMRGKQHSLREAYAWLSDHGPLDLLKSAAKQESPGDRAGGGVASSSRCRTIDAVVEKMFATAWNKVIDTGVEEINGVVGEIKSQTNVKNKKKAPQGTNRDKKWQETSATSATSTTRRAASSRRAKTARTRVSRRAPARRRPHRGGQGSRRSTAGPAPTTTTRKAASTRATSTRAPGSIRWRCNWRRWPRRRCQVPVAGCWDVVDAGRNRYRQSAAQRHQPGGGPVLPAPGRLWFWREPMKNAAGSERLGAGILEQLASKKGGAPDMPGLVESQGTCRQSGQEGGDEKSHDAPPPP